ncbi:hypothetical protein [Virgibacillus sp. YIM 98842]|nr:hypothetical protein [Virgibacillus sp. YIM 98842]
MGQWQWQLPIIFKSNECLILLFLNVCNMVEKDPVAIEVCCGVGWECEDG